MENERVTERGEFVMKRLIRHVHGIKADAIHPYTGEVELMQSERLLDVDRSAAYG